MLWATNGTVTYAFPSYFAVQHTCTEFSISLEICSEAPYFNHDWKSDITFWINGVELATYTCPGDFGNRRGILNPDWWEIGNTQYGEYKVLTVSTRGIYLDGLLVNDKVTLNDLHLADSPAVMFRLGNKPDAQNIGGFNLFGKSFGDYPQDIVLTAKVEE
jgi:predicted transcriptional regulator